MSLIPQDELFTLKDASEVQSVASTAALENEQNTVAYHINSAANNGNTSVEIVFPISTETLTLLQSKGYKVSYSMAVADPTGIVFISWEPDT